MKAITLIIVLLCVYALFYKFYASFIISKILVTDQKDKHLHLNLEMIMIINQQINGFYLDIIL